MIRHFQPIALALFSTLSSPVWAHETAVVYYHGDLSQISIPGDTGSAALSINNSGQIIGLYSTSVMGGLSFSLNNGALTTFTLSGPSGSLSALPYAVNNVGQIVGSYENLNASAGFIYDGTNYTSINGPLGSSGVVNAVGINDPGQVIGTFTAGAAHASFIYDNGAYTILSVPGAKDTTAYGINNLGQVVGYYFANGSNSGFLYDHGVFTTLIVPGSPNTEATGINDLGQIVGNFNGGGQSFLYSNGTYTELGHFFALGINDDGVVVGGVNSVPEPATWAMLLIGFAGVGFMIRWRTAKSDQGGPITP